MNDRELLGDAARAMYRFEHRMVPVIIRETAEAILTGARRVSLDLGLTHVEVGWISDDQVSLAGIRLSLEQLEGLRENVVYEITEDGLKPLEIRTGTHYYKLRPTGPESPPTLEIDGIHMHRISGGMDPIKDSKLKIASARIRRGMRVLDTCMGLGYTSILSMRRGASLVVTVEVDWNVVRLASKNPWSRELSSRRIITLRGDVVELAPRIPSSLFDRIIHDPPRYSETSGPLYSRGFYRELYRILRPGGILYHYTGQPGRRSAKSIVAGIMRRLREVGFECWFDRRSMGAVCRKPRYLA